MNIISQKLFTMGHITGCRRDFFKHEEGKPGDGVATLKANQLRLYGLYFDRTAVIFGSGGYKPLNTRAYQETKALNEKAQQMIHIARIINNAIKNRDVIINDDGSIDNIEIELEL